MYLATTLDTYRERGNTMTRRQRHPLLRKIASRRWRTGRADGQLTWATTPTPQSRDTPHQAHVAGLLSERILTPRETEVLFRVARGETDQQIADKLYLSRRTVSKGAPAAIVPLLDDSLYFEIARNALEQKAFEFEDEQAREILEQMEYEEQSGG